MRERATIWFVRAYAIWLAGGHAGANVCLSMALAYAPPCA